MAIIADRILIDAKVAGLDTDLALTSNQFEWLLTSFYLAYIAFEWMTLLYRVVPPHIYISLCVAAWGVLASLQATATSFWFLLTIRGLLGVSEAAFGPGVPVYLSGFFRREELALRTGLFVAAAPLGASMAGVLAWGITWIGERGPISAWRVLFLVEGFPSVVVAVWAWDFVPDGPGMVKWFSGREREVAVMRLREETEGNEEEGEELEEKGGYQAQEKRGIDMREVWKTLADPKCYLTAVSLSRFLCLFPKLRKYHTDTCSSCSSPATSPSHPCPSSSPPSSTTWATPPSPPKHSPHPHTSSPLSSSYSPPISPTATNPAPHSSSSTRSSPPSATRLLLSVDIFATEALHYDTWHCSPPV